MVFIRDPIPQLFEIGYSLGLIHHELCSQQLQPSRVDISTQMDGCLAAADTIRDRAGTQRDLTAAGTLRVKLEAVAPTVEKASSLNSRSAAAERVRGTLAEARSPASALSAEYGRSWLALGTAVAEWEVKGTPHSRTFLHRCWKLARKLVAKQEKWLDGQVSWAKKCSKRIGSLSSIIRDLFLDYWEYDRAGSHYVAGVDVRLASYRLLVVLRLLDGRGLDTPELARLSGVKGAHNNLSSLRKKPGIKGLISRSNPAVWTDQYFPVPGPSAIPDVLTSHLDWLDTPEGLCEYLRSRIRVIKP